MSRQPKPSAEAAHAKLAPSSAERWLACPGSVALSEGRDSAGIDAARGTFAHMVAHHCFLKGEEAWEHIGEKARVDGFDVEFTVDDAPAVQKYLDYKKIGPEEASATARFFEQRVKITEDLWGTLDQALVDPEVLEVIDYKHGYIPVEPEENPQLKSYALGALAFLAGSKHAVFPRRVRLTIAQPRSPHPRGSIRSWDTTVEALRIWEKNVLLPGAALALSKNAPRHTGPHCRFCPARTVCPELATDAKNLAGTAEDQRAFAASHNPPLSGFNLNDETVGALLQKCEVVSFLHKALQDEAFARLNRGLAIPGYKLVHKKSDRVFREGSLPELEKELGPAIYDEPKLRSPAAIEKLPGGTAIVKRLAYRPDMGLTLAPASDKREGVTRSAKEVFAGVIDPSAGD